jgi:antitoxin HicB
MKRIINEGSSFESFLDEEGILDEVDEAAVKRVIAWQVEREMTARKLNKSQLARRMDTSRTQVDRLLDPDNTSVTLHTLYRAAEVLGKRLRVSLEEADGSAG